MSEEHQTETGRRTLLKAAAWGAVGLLVPVRIAAAPPKGLAVGSSTPTSFEPSAWIRITQDGRVTLTMAQIEMGQGAQTGLAAIIADELEVPFDSVRIEQAPADKERFGVQATGGSTSIREGWKPMREAGATARQMLIQAAAQQWKVEVGSLTARDGDVVHAASGRRAAYGSLVEAASRLPHPDKVFLKDATKFRLVGQSLPRIEGSAKVRGTAVFGIDAAIPARKIATLAQSPEFGGRLQSVKESTALAVPGVIRIVRLPDAVAVIADSMPQAQKGLEGLEIGWSSGPLAKLNTAEIYADLAEATTRPGAVARSVGEPGKADGRRIEAVYQQPLLAHAPMEPMNCTVHVTADGCDVWTGTQVATDAQQAVAKLLGLPIGKVRIHVYLMGGGFGRRLETDGIIRAVEIGRVVKEPLQVIWTRAEDMQHDLYRPAYCDRIWATVDAAGKPTTWNHRIAGSSIMARLYPEAFKGVDSDAVECAAQPVYALSDLRVEFARVECGLPTSWWRGVGPTRSLFVIESFVDELATAARQDPVAYRLSILTDPRAREVLSLAAEKSGWGAKLPAGRGRGIALANAFGSYIALVAEVSIEPKEEVRVRRVVAVIDCGRAVNPDMVRAQIEGGVIFGAGAALMSEITVANGRVEQASYSDYPILTMVNAPNVDVHIVEGAEDPGGVGEIGTAAIAPAITNAIFAATRNRIRTLPVSRSQPVWMG